MTRYEVGFMNKCAEYGLDVGTSVELMKVAAETYGGGISDSFKDFRDSFARGGMKRRSERQQAFNKDYANSSLGWRIKNSIKHPFRSARAANSIANLGTLDTGGK